MWGIGKSFAQDLLTHRTPWLYYNTSYKTLFTSLFSVTHVVIHIVNGSRAYVYVRAAAAALGPVKRNGAFKWVNENTKATRQSPGRLQKDMSRNRPSFISLISNDHDDCGCHDGLIGGVLRSNYVPTYFDFVRRRNKVTAMLEWFKKHTEIVGHFYSRFWRKNVGSAHFLKYFLNALHFLHLWLNNNAKLRILF